MVLILIKMEHFLVDRGFGKNVIVFGADISWTLILSLQHLDK